jgi:hypothetical protein
MLDVTKIQLGYTRWIATARGVKIGLGGNAAVSRVPAAAAAAYGSRVPGEVAVYVNVRPR